MSVNRERSSNDSSVELLCLMVDMESGDVMENDGVYRQERWEKSGVL